MNLILTTNFTLLLILNLISSNTYSQSLTTEINKSEYTYSVKNVDSLKLHVFAEETEPGNKVDTPALVILHGGGWSSGKSTWAFNLARRFAIKGFKGIAVEYRLSNQNDISPINSMKDAKDAVIWLRKNAERLNIHSDKIIVYGWSAGGHLAAGTAVFPKYDKTTGISSIPDAMILSSPALSVTNDNWFKQLLPENEKLISYSPAENIDQKLPPSLILVGKEDTVTPVEQAQMFYQNAIDYGSNSEIHIFENVGHLFTPSNQPDNRQPDPDKETVKKAMSEVDSFLKENGFI